MEEGGLWWRREDCGGGGRVLDGGGRGLGEGGRMQTCPCSYCKQINFFSNDQRVLLQTEEVVTMSTESGLNLCMLHSPTTRGM